MAEDKLAWSPFFAMMDMLPPAQPTAFHLHNKALGAASEKAPLYDMLAASAYLHALHGAEPIEVVDIAVMCDGTWSKRGFTAAYGVVVVISWERWQVLDYEILSKRCNVCQRQKTIWGRVQ